MTLRACDQHLCISKWACLMIKGVFYHLKKQAQMNWKILLPLPEKYFVVFLSRTQFAVNIKNILSLYLKTQWQSPMCTCVCILDWNGWKVSRWTLLIVFQHGLVVICSNEMFISVTSGWPALLSVICLHVHHGLPSFVLTQPAVTTMHCFILKWERCFVSILDA